MIKDFKIFEGKKFPAKDAPDPKYDKGDRVYYHGRLEEMHGYYIIDELIYIFSDQRWVYNLRKDYDNKVVLRYAWESSLSLTEEEGKMKDREFRERQERRREFDFYDEEIWEAVKWYNKGKLEVDTNIPNEPEFQPDMLLEHIMKTEYADHYSYKGYSFLLWNIDFNGTYHSDGHYTKDVEPYAFINLSDEDKELLLNDDIEIVNIEIADTRSFKHWTLTELIKELKEYNLLVNYT